MAKLGLRRVSLATMLTAAGCSGGGAGPTNAGTTAADASTPPASPTVSVTGFVQASDGNLLPGASVCLQGRTACTKSGDGFPPGFFRLSGVPANQSVALTFQKIGFLSSLRAIDTQSSDITLPESETMYVAETPQTFMGTVVD